jgi:predicted MPP superfamily phosphohydrolase
MTVWRVVQGIALALAVFLTLNLITVRTLLAAHPNKRSAIWIATVVGNLMWLLLPLVLSARTTALVRLLRAVFGPPWFSWLIFILLYSFFTILIFLGWLLWRRVPFGDFAHTPSSIFLIALAITTLAGFYQALVPIRIERVTVPIANLPAEFRGYRIAVISDLHVGLFSRASRLRTISRLADGLRPDLVAITGDLIDDDPYFIPKFLRGLEPFAPATNVFAVLGNHEIYGDPLAVIRALEGTRVRLLVNSGTTIGKGNSAIWIAGISDYAAGRRGPAPELRPDLDRAIAAAPANSIVLLLSHQPRAFDEARARGIPLTICGHTHGGQFGIRPLVWSMAGVFLPYHMGLYERDGCRLYVNTGTGYWVVPFRLGMTPEITLIELAN